LFVNLINKIESRYGYITEPISFIQLVRSVSFDLFLNMQKASHCLFCVGFLLLATFHQLAMRRHNFMLLMHAINASLFH